VKELGLEQKVTEAVIHKADEELAEKYCGRMYARGNGNNRYQRAALRPIPRRKGRGMHV
jgi:hypothetical protein